MWRILKGFRSSLVALMFLLGGGTAIALADTQAVVTDIRVGENAGATRVVFDLTNDIVARVFPLSGPFRIVIDFPEVGWRLPSRPLPRDIGVVRKVRYGLFRPGTTRVVLDVTRAVKVRDAFAIASDGEHGFRLVVDLIPAQPEAFRKAVRGPPWEVKATKPVADGNLRPPRSTRTEGTAAREASAFSFLPPPRKPFRRTENPIIVIDPGHGGIDPGAIGAGGSYEKHITLSAAREFKQLLERSGRYRVILTRERDVFIPLRDRVMAARDANADLFLSIHADAIKRSSVRGLSVYTLSEKASDDEAAELADKENKADLIAGIDLSDESPEVTTILIDLAQRESMNQSAQFAARLVNELGREVRLLRNTHRFAGFRVLKAPDIPSVLMEMGFLSNRQDETTLLRKSYRGKLGKALLKAMDSYFAHVEEASRR